MENEVLGSTHGLCYGTILAFACRN